MANSREEDAGAGEPPGSSGTNSIPGSFAEMPAAAQRRKERENRRPAGQRSFFAQNQEQRRFLAESPERCRLCRAGSRQNRAETAGAAARQTADGIRFPLPVPVGAAFGRQHDEAVIVHAAHAVPLIKKAGAGFCVACAGRDHSRTDSTAVRLVYGSGQQRKSKIPNAFASGILEYQNTIDAVAFRFVPKTKPKPGAAGSVWKEAATECVRRDF